MAALLCSPDPDPDPDPELTRPRLTPTHNLAHSGNFLLVKFAQCAGECYSVCVCVRVWRLLLDIMAAI